MTVAENSRDTPDSPAACEFTVWGCGARCVICTPIAPGARIFLASIGPCEFTGRIFSGAYEFKSLTTGDRRYFPLDQALELVAQYSRDTPDSPAACEFTGRIFSGAYEFESPTTGNLEYFPLDQALELIGENSLDVPVSPGARIFLASIGPCEFTGRIFSGAYEFKSLTTGDLRYFHLDQTLELITECDDAGES